MVDTPSCYFVSMCRFFKFTESFPSNFKITTRLTCSENQEPCGAAPRLPLHVRAARPAPGACLAPTPLCSAPAQSPALSPAQLPARSPPFCEGGSLSASASDREDLVFIKSSFFDSPMNYVNRVPHKRSFRKLFMVIGSIRVPSQGVRSAGT